MAEQIGDVISKQRRFYKSGQTKPIEFRIKQLKKLRNQIKRYEDELIEALQKDLGKHPTESYLTEIGLVYRHLDEAIKELPKWSKRKRVKTPMFLWPAKSYTVQAPYGNTLILAPFNYPVLLTLDPLIGAISGGNTAIVGMSEYTEATNYLLKILIEEAFFNDYLFFVTSSKEVNSFLLDMEFNKIFFTGSQRVGKIILKKAADYLTPTTLELGGKSPVIVTKYADLEIAAERIVWGKFMNAGQTCVAPDYCLVDNTIKKDFLKLLSQKINDFFGENLASSKDFGRIINDKAMNRLVKQIEYDQLFIYRGGKYNYEKKYIEPTIISAQLDDELMCMRDEIFGPILPVLGYDQLEEALFLIENLGKPLAFYPFTSNNQELIDLLDRLDFGGSTINDTLLHLSNEHLPFGGIGTSGMGSYHGKKSFDCFTYKKSILKRSTIIRLPLMYPPYTKKKDNMIRTFFN